MRTRDGSRGRVTREIQRERFDPELLKFFEKHRRDWTDGKIRLTDFCEGWQQHGNGQVMPLWYAPPLGHRVVTDKAKFFETVAYKPSLPAARFHASLAKIKVFSGGSRAGKSMAAALEVCPALLSPNVRIWLVAPEYEQARKEFEYILSYTVEHHEIGPKVKPLIKRVANRPHQGDMEIRLSWGNAGESFVLVKSVVRPISLLSEELDIAVVVEASEVPEHCWTRYISPRLITRRGVAIFPSSPSGLGWVAKLYEQGIQGKPGYFAVNADSRMNPTISVDEVRFWAQEMSEEDWQEQVEGRPAPKHGLVYPHFRREIHVDSWQPDWPKPSWRRGRAIDFGFTSPFAVLWIAEDEDWRLYVYREFYKTRQLIDDVVRAIGEAERWDKPDREQINGPTVADWDAAGREELHQRGIHTRRAKKDVISGIRTVQNLLRIQADGRPRLFVAPSCVETLREFAFYQWAPKSDTPKESDDHSLDALRYYAHSVQPYRGCLEIRRISLT